MKKSARRILSLALTLVLICALATAAFAATSHSVEEETSDGSIVCEYAAIDTRSVSGQVYVNDGERMNSLRISIAYSYIMAGTSSTIAQDTYTTTGYDTRSHSGTKTLDSDICSRMVHATYTFRAEIPYEGTFNSTPFTLYYS